MDNLVSSIITTELLDALRSTYALPWNGIHGISHWQRVRDNGLRVAAMTGADLEIVELFAFIHDIKRMNDGSDPRHGRRAAEWARTEGRHLIDLDSDRFEQLAYACEHHTHGAGHASVTVCTCWDADRLDLDRVYITPDPSRLCTPAARDPQVLEWAIHRSHEGRRLRD